jgi:hypothetical protein
MLHTAESVGFRVIRTVLGYKKPIHFS